MRIRHDSVVYVGDGSSDVHVMLHVNRLRRSTIAVSENKYITPIAKRTILSDDACSVLVPILEDLFGWNTSKIRAFFESHGLALQGMGQDSNGSITLCSTAAAPDIVVN